MGDLDDSETKILLPILELLVKGGSVNLAPFLIKMGDLLNNENPTSWDGTLCFLYFLVRASFKDEDPIGRLDFMIDFLSQAQETINKFYKGKADED